MVEGFDLDLEAHREVPVVVGHGSLDPIIPVQLGRSAVDRLQAAGLDVDYHETRMGHTIDPAFARSLAGWLARLTSRRSAA